MASRGDRHTPNPAKHRVTSYQVSIVRKGGKPRSRREGAIFTAASADALKELLDAWIARRGK